MVQASEKKSAEAAAALKKEEAAEELEKAVAEEKEEAVAKKKNETVVADKKAAEAVRLCTKHVCAKLALCVVGHGVGNISAVAPRPLGRCIFAVVVSRCASNVARCAIVLHFARGTGPVCEGARCAFMLHWYWP
jgi:hypothetical protein